MKTLMTFIYYDGFKIMVEDEHGHYKLSHGDKVQHCNTGELNKAIQDFVEMLMKCDVKGERNTMERLCEIECESMDAEDLTALIDRKINEIFYLYQKSHGVKTGDMPPELSNELEAIQKRISEIVVIQVDLNKEDEENNHGY